MSKKKIFLSSLIIALLGFFFLLEFFLPELVAGKIREEIEDRFREEIIVNRVEVKSKPALKLLFGRADRVTIEAEAMSLGALVVDRVEITLEQVEMNFLKTGTTEASVLDQATSLSGKLSISESELNRLITQEGLLPLKEPKLEFQAGKLFLKGSTVILNNSVGVQVIGSLKVVDDRTLAFLPEDLGVAGFTLPSFLEEGLLKQIGFKVSLDNLPMELKLNSIAIDEEFVNIELKK